MPQRLQSGPAKLAKTCMGEMLADAEHHASIACLAPMPHAWQDARDHADEECASDMCRHQMQLSDLAQSYWHDLQ